ncbi:inorganic phosphate transporter [Zeimonas arvi]|jgi:PiT family inorganic phosphate transporter|uniref:Inorganic phosphate transporter n=1 Tax=Zeimonas arvi TaxID=2498847 RepID=A0A5C8NXV7_9BURK|nr:inorganic phosphate transporter [Zeimonas arvi]TXL66148.1 inorganic phosphate transporter [Zeimonas arvi]
MSSVQITFSVLVFLVILALAFDFMNGFHDAANSIATIVSTGVLKPYQAVAWAASFNFLALFLFDLNVAATVGKGIVEAATIDHVVIFGALVGALAWNIITWLFGIPSSSSHALIGGMIGSTLIASGSDSLIASGITKTALFIFVSPALGFLLGGLLMLATSWTFFKATPRGTDRWFRRLQLASSALYSLGHGSNDAQKTMGIIWLLLIAAGVTDAADKRPPEWVVISCYVAIAAGTMFGGWRIVKTMGQKITKLKPVGGFCAETGGAMTLFLASGFGVPVSTTHTITGAIVGVGSSHNVSAVRWGLAGSIVWAWVLTIPASATMAALAWWVGRLLL